MCIRDRYQRRVHGVQLIIGECIMFFSYPDEYSVDISYAYDLIKTNIKEEIVEDESSNLKMDLFRNIDSISKEKMDDNPERLNIKNKKRNSLFDEIDDEYVKAELNIYKQYREQKECSHFCSVIYFHGGNEKAL
eukprot:TRINITY_DN1918_c0_g1_i2.p3 TRINITY_DN1918_c0_g1~~TRINITY_DN1918_c0_g1_i2.p3  ORF type:complete len:134 (-),score=30.59 TRINITY_DN1918_c0_g1_i2:198-599(-)